MLLRFGNQRGVCVVVSGDLGGKFLSSPSWCVRIAIYWFSATSVYKLVNSLLLLFLLHLLSEKSELLTVSLEKGEVV